METELCTLARVHYVDKCPFYHHTYTPQYHEMLQSRRGDVKLLLEIGIGNIPLMAGLTSYKYKPGASLRMWRDYFSNAQIVGCDILKDVQFTDDNITTFVTDQSSVESLNTLIENVGSPDIILDDGSHQEEHQALSFKTLWKSLKPGGIYIIEDVRDTWLERFEKLHFEFGFEDATIQQTYRGKNDWDDNFVAFLKCC